MKDILVVGKLKEGAFEKFMGFMQSDEGMAERKKVADVTKTIASVSPDKSTVMFKIVVHDMAALHSFMDGSNPCLLYTSPSPRDKRQSRMPSSA